MGNVPVQFRTRKQREPLKHAKRKDVLENKFEGFDDKAIDTQHMLISALLPPAVKAFMEECEREVSRLCGSRYKHGKSNSRPVNVVDVYINRLRGKIDHGFSVSYLKTVRGAGYCISDAIDSAD